MNLSVHINIKAFYSKTAVLICLLTMVMTSANIKKWKSPTQLISNDIISYYGYLPATFIYHDLTLKFMEHPPADYRGIFWPGTAPNGGKVMKFSMGMAILYLPFFTLGHLAAGIIGEIQDGYSPAYCFFLILGTVFYVTLGLILLRLILLRYFSDEATALTILSVFLGTNLLQYSTDDPLMSHAYLFTLNICLLYFVMEWHKIPSWKNSIWLGCIAGLVILVRPSDIVSLLIFFLYGIYSLKTLNEKFNLLRRNFLKLVLMGACILVVFFPQMLYWKWNSGDWLYYSYGNEGFYFSNPHIIDGLFSYRKGWLLYAPVMSFSLLGLLLLNRYVKEMTFSLLVFVIINIWIITSWWSWWYGGSFGNRPFIDSYGLLAFPLAGFYSFFMDKSRLKSFVITGVVLLLIFHQIFQTFQYRYQAIHYDSMTKEAYWKSFLKLRPPQGFFELLKEPDYENAVKGLPEHN